MRNNAITLTQEDLLDKWYALTEAGKKSYDDIAGLNYRLGKIIDQVRKFVKSYFEDEQALKEKFVIKNEDGTYKTEKKNGSETLVLTDFKKYAEELEAIRKTEVTIYLSVLLDSEQLEKSNIPANVQAQLFIFEREDEPLEAVTNEKENTN